MAKPNIQLTSNHLERLRMAVTPESPEFFEAASELAIDMHAIGELSAQRSHRLSRSALHVVAERARRHAEDMADGGPSVYYIME